MNPLQAQALLIGREGRQMRPGQLDATRVHLA